MTTTPTLNTQVIGQAEKALGAALDRILAPTGITERQWVTLVITSTGGDTIDHDALVGRMTNVFKITDDAASALLAELTAAHLVETVPGDDSRVRLTETGRAQYRGLRAQVDEVTGRVFDLPADDLATAGRVLTTVTARVNAELAAMAAV